MTNMMDMTRVNMRDRKQIEPRLPKAPTVPQPRVSQMPETVYDEEVLRVAQRDFDNKRMLVTLEQERDEWHRKFLTEQAERKRLEALVKSDGVAYEENRLKLCAEHDAKVDRLERARDDYRVRLKEFETELAVGGNSLLDLANSVAKTMQRLLEKTKVERAEEQDVAGALGLAAVADAIDPPSEQLPRVVTAGPAGEGRAELGPRYF